MNKDEKKSGVSMSNNFVIFQSSVMYTTVQKFGATKKCNLQY